MNNRIQPWYLVTRFFRFAAIPILTISALSACATAQQPTSDDASAVVESKSAPTAPAASVAEGSVLPSSLVYYLHAQRYLQPDWLQDDIASPLLALARTQDLNDHERFFLAQLNFMAFEGEAAYDVFGEFTDRDDWYGWMARMRHTIIDARFYQNFERLETSIKYERENFRFQPEYSIITGLGERALCGHLAEEGEHNRAVDLALATLAQTPRDAPYGTLYLGASCFPSFQEMGREQEAFELTQEIVDQLKPVLAMRNATADQYPAYDAALYENTRDANWYRRSDQAPFNYMTYSLELMITTLEQFLACKRDKISDACPG